MSRPLLLLLLLHQKLLLRIERREGGHEGHDAAQARLKHLHLTLEVAAGPAKRVDDLAVPGDGRFLGVVGRSFQKRRGHRLRHQVGRGGWGRGGAATARNVVCVWNCIREYLGTFTQWQFVKRSKMILTIC